MTELIITEKPSAALKIATALADSKPKKESLNKAPFYRLKHEGKDIIVACAVGHLHTLAEKEKSKGYAYPVFDIEWVESSKVSKQSAFTKNYLNAIKKLCKEADEYTVATDFDVEGEVIGYNVIRFVCNQKDARRMKFSTLTKPDLVKSYAEVMPTLNWGSARAGETRHILDWYYGINLSRALMSAVKKAGRFQVMSIGRVQGPALKVIVSRELEIQKFKPEKYWEIQIDAKKGRSKFIGLHKDDKIFDKDKAENIFKKVKDEKQGKVKEINKKEMKQLPPVPFDLTSLQTESFRHLKYSPKETLAIAQNLYLSGVISYPRTSSQKLPPTIGYKKIITDLSRQSEYNETAQKLLALSALKPTEGKKSDPAHPAIYPTGNTPDPTNLGGREMRLYDLIVRRFFATFGEPAKRLSITAVIDVKKEDFIAKGITTTFPGWHILYGKYAKFKEEELPEMNKDDIIDIKKCEKNEKETQPPKRYSQASLVRELEKKNLGTKATRSEIVDTLFKRGYVDGKPIEATEFGVSTVKTLDKYSPDILDEELTRNVEDMMAEITDGKAKEKDVIEHVKKSLTKIIDGFKKKERDIGKELVEAKNETYIDQNTIGPCPKCKEGTLMIKRGKFGRFIACDKYPDCKTTFNIPNTGMIKKTDKLCEECGVPKIIITRGKRPQEICINPDCPSKKMSPEEAAFEKKEENRKCPKCGEGHLVLRKSVYGSFMGCSNYPKCKYIESLNGKSNEKKEDQKKEDNKKEDNKDKNPATKKIVKKKKAAKKKD